MPVQLADLVIPTLEPVGFPLGWAEDRRRSIEVAIPPGGSSICLTETQIHQTLTCAGLWQGLHTGEQPVPNPRRFRSGLFRRVAREFLEAQVAGAEPVPRDFVADYLSTEANFDALYATWLLLMPTHQKMDLVGELSASLSNLLTNWPVIAAIGDVTVGPVLEDLAIGGIKLISDEVDLTLGDRHLGIEVAWPGAVLTRFVVSKPHPRQLERMALSAVVHGLSTGCPPSRLVVYGLTSGEGIGTDVERQWIELAIASIRTAVREIDNIENDRPTQLTAGHHCVECPYRNTCPISEAEQYPF